MKTTIDLYDFRDAFCRMDRKTNFSYDGLEILFDYLEDFENGTGEEIELDVIALCCDFSEDTPEAIAKAYNVDIEGKDEQGIAEAVQEYLDFEGCYVGTTDLGLFVYRNH
jgi:hypothetical protein